MTEFLPVAGVIATIFTIINVLRSARGQDWDGVLTPLVVWAAGVIGVYLTAQSDWGDVGQLAALTGGKAWSDLSFPSILLLGLHLGSGATTLNEAFGALDKSRSTAKPRMLTGDRSVIMDDVVVVDTPPVSGQP